MFHEYGNAPSIIQSFYSNGTLISIYIGGKGELFCTLQDDKRNYIKTKSAASQLDIEQVNILPQIAPLLKEEKILNKEYVRQNISSDLAPLHFRNQLTLLFGHFEKFSMYAEEYWTGLRIRELTQGNGLPGDKLSLMIQDSGFVAEVSWMGHGLQMWLQIMWFLARTNENELVILDEPDVYMHPELQRKLIKLLIKKFNQVIVSTHSIEIISEVEAENILIIDKSKDKSIFASKVPVVQRILNSIGSIHNLQLTKLWSSKKLLIVEGEDVAILKRLQNKIYPDSAEPFDAIPNFDIGGWGGWSFAKGSSLLLRETVDNSISIYCLFDSDYYTIEQKAERLAEGKKLGVRIHIWNKKEIENYLAIPSVILRVINKESKKTLSVTIKEVEDKISKITKDFEEYIIDSFATEIQSRDKKLSVMTVRKTAKTYIDDLTCRISGKQLISELSRWTHENFNVTLNPIKLANHIEKNEIASELKAVITSIETCRPI